MHVNIRVVNIKPLMYRDGPPEHEKNSIFELYPSFLNAKANEEVRVRMSKIVNLYQKNEGQI